MNSARSHRNFSAVYRKFSARSLRERLRRMPTASIDNALPSSDGKWKLPTLALADHRKTPLRNRELHLLEPDLSNTVHPRIQITITKRWTRSRGGDRIDANCADGWRHCIRFVLLASCIVAARSSQTLSGFSLSTSIDQTTVHGVLWRRQSRNFRRCSIPFPLGLFSRDLHDHLLLSKEPTSLTCLRLHRQSFPKYLRAG